MRISLNRRNDRGATLAEVIIVVLIIAITAIFGITIYSWRMRNMYVASGNNLAGGTGVTKLASTEACRQGIAGVKGGDPCTGSAGSAGGSGGGSTGGSGSGVSGSGAGGSSSGGGGLGGSGGSSEKATNKAGGSASLKGSWNKWSSSGQKEYTKSVGGGAGGSGEEGGAKGGGEGGGKKSSIKGEASAGASHEFAKGETSGSLTGEKSFAGGTEKLSGGYGKAEGSGEAFANTKDGIGVKGSAGARVSALHEEGGHTLAGGIDEKHSVDVLTAKAQVEGQLAAGKEGVGAKVSGEVGANLVEAKVEGKKTFHIPGTKIGIEIGGGASGAVGANASGEATAGYFKGKGGEPSKVGFKLGGKAAVGVGLGLKLSFNVVW